MKTFTDEDASVSDSEPRNVFSFNFRQTENIKIESSPNIRQMKAKEIQLCFIRGNI